jgi:predicted NBD/HSP70 family sugar kinase
MMNARVEQILNLLVEEIDERMQKRRPAAVPPAPAPQPVQAPLPPKAEKHPLAPPEPEPEPPVSPGPSHAARLMGRLALGLLVAVVAINVPFNRHGTTLATAMPDAASLVIRNGLVVKEQSSPDIYVYENGKFRRIASLDVFEYRHYTWRDVHIVEDGFLNDFEKGVPIYDIVKCNDSPHVYRLENGQKRWIRDIETFTAEGYVWEDVRFVSCAYLRGLRLFVAADKRDILMNARSHGGRRIAMSEAFRLIEPAIVPPLDTGFRPAVLANRAFRQEVEAAEGGVPLVLGLERSNGAVSRFETCVFPEGHSRAGANLVYAERLFKFLLWKHGAWRVYVGGPRSIGAYIGRCYAPGGAREFDYHFMGEDVYEKTFTVIPCEPDQVPAEQEIKRPLGRHLDGCRIGFDLGASDRKVSAVIDGKVVFSEEVVWDPGKQSDPQYHYDEIMAALKKAAAKMPRVDAIGGSSAGVYINNRPRIASLFRGIPRARFGEIGNLFLRIRDEMGVPLEVINDGEVTALAGSMSLEDNGVLGVALGSSEAAGCVTMEGHVTDWLNELAFAPVDYSPAAPVDEWSGDRGCGALYFSQQCVFRLAPAVGIALPAGATNAERLKSVQEKLETGHAGAVKIWQTMGVYMGYGIAHYADFYALKHVLILGRCTSGRGGQLILDGANDVLGAEFPELAARINIQLPDEKSRRVGQSIAAASLPALD